MELTLDERADAATDFFQELYRLMRVYEAALGNRGAAAVRALDEMKAKETNDGV